VPLCLYYVLCFFVSWYNQNYYTIIIMLYAIWNYKLLSAIYWMDNHEQTVETSHHTIQLSSITTLKCLVVPSMCNAHDACCIPIRPATLIRCHINYYRNDNVQGSPLTAEILWPRFYMNAVASSLTGLKIWIFFISFIFKTKIARCLWFSFCLIYFMPVSAW